jgi:plastocyanin
VASTQPLIVSALLRYHDLHNGMSNETLAAMSTRRILVATLTLMLATVLAQSPAQTTTDDRMGAASSATSASPTAGIASPTSSVTSQTRDNHVRVHVVKAGAGGFHFEPAELTNVSVGDIVAFEFYPPDHSVARAEYGSACVPYEYTGRNRAGFWSETQWVDTPDDVSTPTRVLQLQAIG